jgi:thioredoxin 1
MGSAVELNIDNWEKEVSQSEILTVVYFWHQQCPWCIRLTQIFNEIAKEYVEKIKFAKLNILESPSNQELATNLGIMSTPTLMFFCNGRPVGQTVGLMSEEELGRVLNDMLGRYKMCIKQSSDLRNYIV